LVKRIRDKAGEEWVISRERGGQTELVHVTTGLLVKVPTHSIPRDRIYLVEKPILPDLPFLQRPREFLTKLREMRHGSMLARVRAARTKKEPKAKATGATRKVRSSKRQTLALAQIDATLEAKLAELPAELREQAKRMWKGS
jgi:hypothetical protein